MDKANDSAPSPRYPMAAWPPSRTLGPSKKKKARTQPPPRPSCFQNDSQGLRSWEPSRSEELITLSLCPFIQSCVEPWQQTGYTDRMTRAIFFVGSNGPSATYKVLRSVVRVALVLIVYLLSNTTGFLCLRGSLEHGHDSRASCPPQICFDYN